MIQTHLPSFLPRCAAATPYDIGQNPTSQPSVIFLAGGRACRGDPEEHWGRAGEVQLVLAVLRRETSGISP